MSDDGRMILFESWASNLVPWDSNRTADVFVFDSHSGMTTRVSTSTEGIQANGRSYALDISSDGVLVAFASDADNLVEGDTNDARDVFIKNLSTGLTKRVSLDGNGEQFPGGMYEAIFNDDLDRFAFFSTDESLSVHSDEYLDLYVKDTQTGTITLVSANESGEPGDRDAHDAAISGDGRFVAFTSRATNLVIDDTNNRKDVFVKNLVTGAMIRVSTSETGAQRHGES